MQAAVPLYVVKALAAVQETSETNMLDRAAVVKRVRNPRAVEWLNKASASDFMEALNEMGEYISVPPGNREEPYNMAGQPPMIDPDA